MTTTHNQHRELKGIGYELFMAALSVLSIVNLLLQLFLPGDENLQAVIEAMNFIITPVFMGDFLYRFFTAESKHGYFFLGYGWADFLSSLPFPHAKILRLFRLWRVIRLFVEFGGRGLWTEMVNKRAQNTLLSVIFLVLCVLEFGAIGVLSAESQSPVANITNAPDALWWVYVTITTVGYGDKYPVTNAGRLVGVMVMTSGVGLFGTLSAFLANSFLSARKRETPAGASASQMTLPGVQAEYAELRRLMATQEEVMAQMKARLAALEAAGAAALAGAPNQEQQVGPQGQP